MLKLIDFIFYQICKAYRKFDESDPEIYAIGAIPLVFFINFYIIKLLLEKLELYEMKLSNFSIVSFFILSFSILGIKHYVYEKSIVKEVNNIKVSTVIIQYILTTCFVFLFFILTNFL